VAGFQPGVDLPTCPQFCRTGVFNVAYKSVRALFTALVIGSLCGCVSLPHPTEQETRSTHPPVPANFPVHIAVLPLNNGSSSVDGPLIVRAFAIRKIGYELGFIITRADEVDGTLASRDLVWSGHPGGHQPLSKQDPATMASWLGVDGILYGELGSYSKQSLSLYSETSVKVHFWLVDAAGKKIWEGRQDSGGGGLSLGSGSLDNVLSDGSIPPDIQDKIRHSDVSQTAFEAVESAFANFPRRSN
jgi:hypothetical protein